MEQCGLVKQRISGSSCAGLDAVRPDGHLLLDSCWCCASPVAGGQAGEVQVLQGHHGCECFAASVLTPGINCDSAVLLVVMLQAVCCQANHALLLCMHSVPCIHALCLT